MKQRMLFAYQLLTGLSDTATGLLLISSPSLTLALMRVHAPHPAFAFLSYVGAFVLSTGIACLYGAWLATRKGTRPKLETVWLLTAVTRGLVALFVASKILTGELETGWLSVALSDATLAMLQVVGLAKGWLFHASR